MTIALLRPPPARRPLNTGFGRYALLIRLGSVGKILEVARRRADDGLALERDLEDGEAALHHPLLGEAEQPVDAGEPARVEDRVVRERLAALAEHRGERRGIEGERGEPRRRMAVGRLEAALEFLARLGRRRG